MGLILKGNLFFRQSFLDYFQANLWRDVTVEYLQFNDKKCLRKVPIDKFNNEPCQWSLKENDFCLHDRLMYEIKQRRRPEKSLTTGSIRKRIRPIKVKKNILEK